MHLIYKNNTCNIFLLEVDIIIVLLKFVLWLVAFFKVL